MGEAKKFYEDVVLQYSDDDCLIWPYAKNKGYGVVGRAEKGKTNSVCRLACEAVHGPPIEAGLEAAHSCNNGHLGCCNPKHLRWATRLENAADATAAGHCFATINPDIVRRIRVMSKTHLQKDIATFFKVSPTCVRGVITGRTWRHVAYWWISDRIIAMNVFLMPAYEAVKITDGIDVLRSLFPNGEANDLNFVMFSTSGTHGSYLSIEDVAASLDTDEPEKLTVLVIQPRVVRMLYGEIAITAEDVPFLLKLRESSKRVFAEQ